METVLDLRESYNSTSISLSVQKSEKTEGKKLSPRIAYLFSLPLISAPTVAFAAAETGTFEKLYNSAVTLFDYAIVLVIMFAGASWMLGHRAKAIEQLIGGTCGYLLALSAIALRDFLKTLV